MKTLDKLTINSENLLKNNELKSLLGGDWSGSCWIYEAGTLRKIIPASGPTCCEVEDIMYNYYKDYGYTVDCQCFN
jgi:hypothetical protein